jgi:ApaG protein
MVLRDPPRQKPLSRDSIARMNDATNSPAAPKPYDIKVSANAFFVPDQSDEANDQYVFAYTMRITNIGSVRAKLLSRHWIITDADNNVQEVRGVGVVGVQPDLGPGESFEYTSGASLETIVGTMRGVYHMQAEDGTKFDAIIPEFTLSVPRVIH